MTTAAALPSRKGVRVAQRAHDRFGLVLVLLLTTYALASVLPDSAASLALIVAFQGVTALVALAASQASFRTRRTAALLASVAVVAGAASASAGGAGSGIAELITALLLFGSAGAILRRIAAHDQVTVQTLLGAIDAYIVFGLLYAFVYAGIGRIGSGDFFASGAHETLSNYLFFSYTTLTTTGYGNLVPAAQVGQTVAVLEALTGQIYLVTVVARLVALWRRRDRD